LKRRLGDHKKLPVNDRKALKTKLDKVFGEYIKLCGNYRCEIAPHGCKCNGDMQPNHLITRGMLSLRWDEDNCVCGCSGHNTWAHWNPIEWEKLWRSLWPERAERLDAKRQNAEKVTTEWLREKVEYYENQIKDCVPKEKP